MHDCVANLSIQQQRKLCEICWRYEQAIAEGKEVKPQDLLELAPDIAPNIILNELTEIQKEIDNPTRTPRPSISIADDRYELINEIARGGTAVVWRVYDRHLRRQTAIKCLLDSQDNEQMRSRLEREARLSGRLTHPGIVPIHELSSFADGRPFVCMKLVEGQTLLQLLEGSKAISCAEAVQVFEKVCQTMAYAHDKGIIHRDLKPSNIMVGAFGEVQIMDWGWAKDLRIEDPTESPCGPMGEPVSPWLPTNDSSSSEKTPNEDTELTVHGAVFGTLSYMSPEQANGEIDQIDQRSDVFSLGAILCRILTGSPPYTGADQSELLCKAQQGQLSHCFDKLKTVPQHALAKLATRCLSIDQNARPKDAKGVLEALLSIRQSQSRKRRWLLACGSFTITCIALIFVWRAMPNFGMPKPTHSEDLASSFSAERTAGAHPEVEDVTETTSPSPPADAEFQRNLFITLLNRERFNNAKQVALELIRLDPDYAEHHYMLGEACFWLGELREAKQSMLMCKSLAQKGRDDGIPLDSTLLRIERSLAIAEELKSKSIESFLARPVSEVLEIAKVCDVVNDIEGAIRCYEHAIESEKDDFAKNALIDTTIIRFSRKKLLFSQLTPEQRHLIYQATCTWMLGHIAFIKQLRENPEESRVSYSAIRDRLKFDQNFKFIRDGAHDMTIAPELRQQLTDVVDQLESL